MAPRLLALAALSGAGVLWLLLAAPELPALRRRLAERARGLLRVDEVATDLAQAEMAWLSPRAWIVLRWTLAAAAVLFGFAVFGLVVVAAVAGLAVYHLAGVGLEARRRHVEERRQRALLDAIRFGISVMARSGSATQMLKGLATTGPFESRPIFEELVTAAASGETSLPAAVESVRSRLADPLFDDLALALSLHWTRGGKLVPALEALVGDWEETLRLQRDAKALRAGVEASVLLLTLLPFAFLWMIHALAPSLLAPLAKPAGEIFFALAVGWMVIGYRVLQAMSRPPREERIALNEVSA
jgi:Flp pilus assembly protein TadB